MVVKQPLRQRVTQATHETIDLGRKLAAAHLAVSLVLGAWLLLARSGRASPLANEMAISVLALMHLPLTAAIHGGLFGKLSWWLAIPAAVILLAAGTIGWGLASAGLVVWLRRLMDE